MGKGSGSAGDDMRSSASYTTSSIGQRLVGDDGAEDEAGEVRRHGGGCWRNVRSRSRCVTSRFVPSAIAPRGSVRLGGDGIHENRNGGPEYVHEEIQTEGAIRWWRQVRRGALASAMNSPHVPRDESMASGISPMCMSNLEKMRRNATDRRSPPQCC